MCYTVAMKAYLPLLAVLPVLAFSQEDRSLRNLPPVEKGQGPRVAVPADLVWPEKPGDADVCLWKDDKFAACSITIDDNCKPDHDWWLKLTEECGIKVTWFVITDGVVNKKNPGFAGTWADWQRLADAGHAIESHTTNHRSAKKGEEIPEEDLRAMYGDSLKAINENITGHVASCIAYPSGDAHADIAKDYAIACRGVYGVPSAAGTINYLCTNKGAGGEGYIDVILTGTTDKDPKWLAGKKELRRGWNIVLYHFVHAGRSDEEKEKNAAGAEAEVRNIAAHKDVIWVGRFPDVARYGQERDTAELKTVSVAADRIELSLADRMDDALFAYPLTVKVRLPDDWKTADATQAAAAAPCRVVEHDGAHFALVDAVPDRGAILLMRK